MTEIFLKIFNMSIAASWLVLAVILLRLLLRKASKWILCLLWGIVGLRLGMPFSMESPISLIPSPEVIPLDIAASEAPAIYSGIPAVNSAVNPLVTQHVSGNELEEILFYGAAVWLAGVAVMALCSAVTYLKLRHQVKASLCYRDNIYACDGVETPFLLGIFHPRIYIPSGISEDVLGFVLAHENAHLKRRDHWWKPLGFLLLTVYWFNPLLWVAYILLCRDIERACDEKVVSGMDPAGKAGYSAALIACSVHRRMVMACPVAFGEIGVKARIKGLLRYKKPGFWIVCVSILLCAVTAVCFLTDPVPCRHVYQGQITTEPTCTERGIQTRLCSLCLHSYTVWVEPAEHIYDDGVVTQEANCLHLGNRLFQCVNCGDHRNEPIEKTGHVAGEPTYLKEPNCTEQGEKSATCGCCGTVFVTQVLPTNGDHDLQETVVKEATCASDGEGAYVCSRCGYSESFTYERLPHNYVRQDGVQATCMSPGFDLMVCTGCDSAYQVEIPTKEHNWTDTGNGYRVCTICGWRTQTGGFSFVDSNNGSVMPTFPSIEIWP